jgi:hypothetical protein
MRTHPNPAALLLVAALTAALAACTGGTSASASPSGPAPTSPSAPPSSAKPQPKPDPSTYWLRAMTTQALPPLNIFGMLPMAVITGDGILVTPGPVPAIFPGPAVIGLQGRAITEAGRLAIVVLAQKLGLLDGKGDFTGGTLPPGGVAGRIEITVDGKRVTISGNPQAPTGCAKEPCLPAAGTPAAFAELWLRLGDLAPWIGPELGNPSTYDPPAYAILVGPAPTPDPMLPQPPVDWPLASLLALFGGPVANGTARCGTISGADAVTLRAALAKANMLSQWVQDPSTNATFGLKVRPMVAGEDACRETFGPA